MTSWPAYLRAWESGELGARVDEALRCLKSCTVCPRSCKVDRLRNETKLCHVGRRARVSSYFQHLGEEDCLRGFNGSGTIFFSFCNLRCVFCQNWDISAGGEGEEVDAHALAAMMIDLQDRGCHNINFVTPEHVVPQVLEALPQAIERGLRLPLVYNTSAYDSLHSLQLLDGIVDIYMPDFKTWHQRTSSRLLKARDYPERARAAIAEMHRQVGPLELDAQGIARRGVLVRHLVMPGGLDETAEIFKWLAALSPETYVNVMDQYHPAGLAAAEPQRYPALCRGLTHKEYEQALSLFRRAGLTRLDTRKPHPMLQKLLRRLL